MLEIIQKLHKLADSSASLEAFLQALPGVCSYAEAVAILAAEFGTPEEFYAWAKHEARTAGAVELHPKIKEIEAECFRLQARLELMVIEWNELMHHTLPVLEAEYTLKIGVLDFELFKLNYENMVMKTEIALLQADLNRGQKPDAEAIKKTLDEELKLWREKLSQLKSDMDRASRILSGLLSPEEAEELKRRYKKLVKLLHPDLFPEQSQRDKDLFIQVQIAYAEGDLERLKLLAALVDDATGTLTFPEQSGLEARIAFRDKLKAKLQEVRLKLHKVKTAFPYNIKDKLSDPVWVQESKDRLNKEIEQELARNKALQKMLSTLRSACGHES